MTWMNGGLQAVFGTALAALSGDGVLHKMALTDVGAGAFSADGVDHPVKVMVDSLSDQDRAAAGLPRTAVRLNVLAYGLQVAIDIDDTLTIGPATYRIVRVETDAAGVSFALMGVPA